MSVIKTEALTKRFGLRTAVDSVSIEIKQGEIFGFLGPNGSGKTTVMKMLCGLLQASGGTAGVLGFDIRTDGEEIRKNIGYMSQQFSLYEDLTVTENMRFYAAVYGLDKQSSSQRCDFLQKKLNLDDFTNTLAANLSGGWKQRLAFACAVIHEPKVLFLDEPTAGIDPVARRELWDIFFEYAATGVTFFVTTHYMDEAERCSSLGYIYLSKLIAFGRPDELKALEAVNPKGFTRAEVTAMPIAKALDVLKKSKFTKDATIFGRSVHLLYDEKTSQTDIVGFLDANGVLCEQIRPIDASLEDVFVALTKEMDAK